MSGPQQTGTLIVGGGITGASIAYHLMRGGRRRLMLIEKESLASGATGICPGGIRQQFTTESDCVLARRSMSFWRSIDRQLRPDDPFEFEQSGYLFVADSQQRLDTYRENVRMQNRIGIPSRILDPERVADCVPALDVSGVAGASWCPEDGFLEDCHGVVDWMCRRAVERGAAVRFQEAVRIEPRQDGWLVQTRESSIACRQLVLAAGVETASLLAPLGIRLPLQAQTRRLAFTEPHDPWVLPPLVVALERGFAGKQLKNGVFYLGWTGETGTEDDLDFLEKGLSAGATLLPLLGDLPVRRILRGVYDTTPDHRPLLGPLPGRPGLFVACGFSGHGFMIAPAVGQALAALLLEASCDLPLDAFRVDRFRDGVEGEGMVI